MSSNAEKTDPGFKSKLKEAVKKANAKADPFADRLLGRIQGSEWSAVIIVLVVLAALGAGLWAAW